MKLVIEASRAWRWFSVQALGALAVLPLVWQTFPPELQAWIPPEWRPYILAGVAIGGIVGRLIDQGDGE